MVLAEVHQTLEVDEGLIENVHEEGTVSSLIEDAMAFDSINVDRHIASGSTSTCNAVINNSDSVSTTSCALSWDILRESDDDNFN